LIVYSGKAERQVIALLHHYEDLGRVAASRALAIALDEAERRIEHNPSACLTAPRPYPQLARYGLAWIKSGRYWIAYSADRPPVIAGVFFETANIPQRM
jgi:hypothetical protein